MNPAKPARRTTLLRLAALGVMPTGLLVPTSSGAQSPVSATPTPAPTPTAGELSGAAPIFVVGDSWTWRRTEMIGPKDERITSRTVREVDAQGSWHLLTRHDKVQRWLAYDTVTGKLVDSRNFDGAAPNQRGASLGSGGDSYVEFPLNVGAAYAVNQTWTNDGGDPGKSELKAKVVGLETIKVPAGDFRAFVIEFGGRWTNLRSGNSGGQEYKIWFAPATKSLVREELRNYWSGGNNSRLTELITHTPGKPA